MPVQVASSLHSFFRNMTQRHRYAKVSGLPKPLAVLYMKASRLGVRNGRTCGIGEPPYPESPARVLQS